MRAAEKLIAQAGVENVSIRKIIAAAGQKNESALQYHFKNLTASWTPFTRSVPNRFRQSGQNHLPQHSQKHRSHPCAGSARSWLNPPSSSRAEAWNFAATSKPSGTNWRSPKHHPCKQFPVKARRAERTADRRPAQRGPAAPRRRSLPAAHGSRNHAVLRVHVSPGEAEERFSRATIRSVPAHPHRRAGRPVKRAGLSRNARVEERILRQRGNRRRLGGLVGLTIFWMPARLSWPDLFMNERSEVGKSGENAVLVTHNTDEFRRVTNLIVEDWADLDS